jgi:hypothetical protein
VCEGGCPAASSGRLISDLEQQATRRSINRIDFTYCAKKSRLRWLVAGHVQRHRRRCAQMEKKEQ